MDTLQRVVMYISARLTSLTSQLLQAAIAVRPASHRVSPGTMVVSCRQ